MEGGEEGEGRTDARHALSCVGEVVAKGMCGGTEGQIHTRPTQSCQGETGMSCCSLNQNSTHIYEIFPDLVWVHISTDLYAKRVS